MTDREPDKGTRRIPIAAVAGVLLLAAAAVLRAYRADRLAEPSPAAYVTGGLLFALIVALALRAAWVRWGTEGKRLFEPGGFLLAWGSSALITLVMVAGGENRQAGEDTIDDANSAIESGQELCSEPLPEKTADGSISLGAAPPGYERPIRSKLEESYLDAASDAAEVLGAYEKRRLLGVIVLIPFDPSVDAEDPDGFANGTEAAAREAGFEPETSTLSGHSVISYGPRGRYLSSSSAGCYLIQTVTAGSEDGRSLMEATLETLE